MAYKRKTKKVYKKYAVYTEADRDNVKLWADLLADNSIKNVCKVSGYSKNFVYKTLRYYTPI
ncbi:hypothetical protein C7967_11514 [Thalassospira sp. 11-3]|nr:hypothetical protein C7967_11514 [Thalassospira sp. 11-3]